MRSIGIPQNMTGRACQGHLVTRFPLRPAVAGLRRTGPRITFQKAVQFLSPIDRRGILRSFMRRRRFNALRLHPAFH